MWDVSAGVPAVFPRVRSAEQDSDDRSRRGLNDATACAALEDAPIGTVAGVGWVGVLRCRDAVEDFRFVEPEFLCPGGSVVA